MVKNVDISNMNLNGCPQSVRREIEAMRDDYLERGSTSRELRPQKGERDFTKYLFFLKKVLSKKNKGSK